MFTTKKLLISFITCLGIAWAHSPKSASGRANVQSLNSAVASSASYKNLGFSVSGAMDGRGNLWIGTENKGVWRAGPDGTRFFTTADGLGDDDVYGVAADKKGRVWVGHSSHGISIFNGTAWKNYSAVDGPGGSRVFAIAICPTDGDVWIATEAGLARYSQATDAWSWLNRSTGLPDDQVSSLAFDAAGNLYVGLQCDGVAVARAGDQYKTWHSQTGPDVMPAAAHGDGLPGPLVNAMLATRADVVYAGTTRGIAWTKDQGDTWQYLRGTNWATLVAAGFDGAPKDMVKSTTPLKEDWTTSLAEDSQGRIIVGHRDKGYEVLSDKLEFIDGGTAVVRTIVSLPGDGLAIGTYGHGLVYVPGTHEQPDSATTLPPPAVAEFPSTAKPATAEQLEQMRQAILALAPAKSNVEILPDDWESKGDWIGRYGREYSLFSGYNWGGDSSGGNTYSVSLCTGPYALDASVYSYEELLSKVQFPINSLFNPRRHQRVAGEFNDGSFDRKKYPQDKDGPDLFAAVRVPAGNHRISLHFFNQDGHTGGNIDRDFYLHVKSLGVQTTAKQDLVNDSPDQAKGFVLPGSAAIDAELSETVARLRLPPFWNGCYKRVLVRGPGSFWIKIGRNYSFVTKLQGVFVDGEGDSAAAQDAVPILLSGLPDLNVPRCDGDPTLLPGITGAAAKLWAAVDSSVGREGYASYAHPLRMAAYRAAASATASDPKLLENWRWRLNLWNDEERQQINSLIQNKSATPIENN